MEDAEHLQRGAEHLGPVVHAVLDALYDHLLSLLETRGFFETQGIQYRKQSLVSWITRIIEGPHNGQYWNYLVRVGKVHRDYRVSYYQIVHFIGWVQGTITSALLTSNRPKKEAEAGAWIKMLTTQLDPTLLTFQEPVS